eukprot:119978-Amphidinium_carterae.1
MNVLRCHAMLLTASLSMIAYLTSCLKPVLHSAVYRVQVAEHSALISLSTYPTPFKLDPAKWQRCREHI